MTPLEQLLERLQGVEAQYKAEQEAREKSELQAAKCVRCLSTIVAKLRDEYVTLRKQLGDARSEEVVQRHSVVDKERAVENMAKVSSKHDYAEELQRLQALAKLQVNKLKEDRNRLVSRGQELETNASKHSSLQERVELDSMLNKKKAEVTDLRRRLAASQEECSDLQSSLLRNDLRVGPPSSHAALVPIPLQEFGSKNFTAAEVQQRLDISLSQCAALRNDIAGAKMKHGRVGLTSTAASTAASTADETELVRWKEGGGAPLNHTTVLNTTSRVEKIMTFSMSDGDDDVGESVDTSRVEKMMTFSMSDGDDHVGDSVDTTHLEFEKIFELLSTMPHERALEAGLRLVTQLQLQNANQGGYCVDEGDRFEAPLRKLQQLLKILQAGSEAQDKDKYNAPLHELQQTIVQLNQKSSSKRITSEPNMVQLRARAAALPCRTPLSILAVTSPGAHAVFYRRFCHGAGWRNNK